MWIKGAQECVSLSVSKHLTSQLHLRLTPSPPHPQPSMQACPLSQDFLCSSVGKESSCSAGDPGSIPGSGRSPGEGNGNPLQYSCLENPMDRGAWWATVHGVERVRHDLATKPPPPLSQHESLSLNGLCCPVRGSGNGISLSIFFFLIFGHTKWHLGQSTSGILVP